MPVDLACLLRNNIYVFGICGEGKSATHRPAALMAQKRFDATLIHTTVRLAEVPTTIRYGASASRTRSRWPCRSAGPELRFAAFQLTRLSAVVGVQTPKVKRLPVFQSTSCSGISSRILAMKARPVQCIGITRSGAIAFNSAIVCST